MRLCLGSGAQAAAKETGKVLITSAEVAKLGGPTFVAWIARKDFAKSHPDDVTAFTKVTLDAYAHFRKDPADYRAGTDEAKKIADFNGAKAEEIFDEDRRRLLSAGPRAGVCKLLGKGTADAIAATAAFLLEQKKVDALLPGYSAPRHGRVREGRYRDQLTPRPIGGAQPGVPPSSLEERP